MFFCFSKLSNGCIGDRGLAGSDDGHGSDGSDDGHGSDGSDDGSDGSDGRRISAM